MIPVLLTISSEGLCYTPSPYVRRIFWRKVSKNVLYDELYQILAGLPTVLEDLSEVRCLWFAARGQNWEDWFGGWHKSGGEVAKRGISIKDCTFGRKYGIFRHELGRSAPRGWKCGFLREMSINNTR
jgi:hypothetical protein